MPVKSATKLLAGARNTSATGPAWTICPWSMMATRSARTVASVWSCVTKIAGTADSRRKGAQFLAQRVARAGIQRGERLVEQEDLGLHHQRASQSGALLLTRTEIVRQPVCQMVDAKTGEQLPDNGVPRPHRSSADAQAECDVRRHRQMREQAVILESATQRVAAPVAGKLRRAR